MDYHQILQRFQYEDESDIHQRVCETNKQDLQQNRDIINQIVLWKLNRSVAVASAILHFYYPDIFPIIDQRSYRELYDREFPIYLDKQKEEKYVELYLEYIEDCYEYQQRNCPTISFAYIDKILYQIDKEKGNKVRY